MIQKNPPISATLGNYFAVLNKNEFLDLLAAHDNLDENLNHFSYVTCGYLFYFDHNRNANRALHILKE